MMQDRQVVALIAGMLKAAVIVADNSTAWRAPPAEFVRAAEDLLKAAKRGSKELSVDEQPAASRMQYTTRVQNIATKVPIDAFMKESQLLDLTKAYYARQEQAGVLWYDKRFSLATCPDQTFIPEDATHVVIFP